MLEQPHKRDGGARSDVPPVQVKGKGIVLKYNTCGSWATGMSAPARSIYGAFHPGPYSPVRASGKKHYTQMNQQADVRQELFAIWTNHIYTLPRLPVLHVAA